MVMNKMKITKRQLKRIIREEKQSLLREWFSDEHDPKTGKRDQYSEKEEIYRQAGLSEEESRITDSAILDDDGFWIENPAFEKLYNYFMDLGTMPYGVATGDTGEPDLWILDYLKGI